MALIAGLASVLSFPYLAWLVGGYSPEIGRVVYVDIVALICLVIGAAAQLRTQRSG